MSASSHHAEWLSLVEVTGPFLTLPVLEKVFPQGLEARDPDLARDVKFAYGEWRQETESRDPHPQVHEAWLRLVIDRVLGYPEEVLEVNEETEDPVSVEVPEQREHIVPDYLLREPGEDSDGREARLAIEVWPAGQVLEDRVEDSRWVASPARRMARFCKSTGIRLGLVTNGERWMLVNAPEGETTGFISWYAYLWTDEPLALRSFRSLLGVRRFFGVEEPETLTGMLEASKDYQAEVTDRLGDQVRRAVEVLIEAMDKADADTGRELLQGVSEERLYEAALTVMMRLVFLFCAEERDLLLLGDDQYDQYYAVSTLGGQLRETADRHGLQILEHREDAWGRILATFRAIYGGIQHEDLRLPAYGSSLFDPDRFPFLEGRAEESDWRETPADPLPIDNRTVLHLLDALQLLQMQQGGGRKEARKLSYRSLDIEQIGYVYERLLDHSAVRADGPVLGLQGTKYKEPEIPLAQLEDRYGEGEDELVEYLHDMTGRTQSALRKRVDVEPEGERLDALRVACGNDELLERVLPFQALLREDPWGDPIVIGSGSVYVTEGTERQATGTHYTPRALTEEIVQYALEPLVYEGPSEGRPRDEWELGSAEEILDLKVCDPAMGSGAFLVQTVRWLGDRVQEAWEEAEEKHGRVDLFGLPVDSDGSTSDRVPTGSEERQVTARRLVAERCIYGVDVNPLAVEIAKLSVWLVTLAKGRPFSFLDHNLRRGDSLLGVSSLNQLCEYHPRPEQVDGRPQSLFDPRPYIEDTITEVKAERERIEASPSLDISDSLEKRKLYHTYQSVTADISFLADILTVAAFPGPDDMDEVEAHLRNFSPYVRDYISDSHNSSSTEQEVPSEEKLRSLAERVLPDGQDTDSFFHWPLEFPEVFTNGRSGFDTIIMNPPFLGNKYWKARLGPSFSNWAEWIVGTRPGKIDLAVIFYRRAAGLLGPNKMLSGLATTSIAEGRSAEIGLKKLCEAGTIVRAESNRDWPGSANIDIALLWLSMGDWQGRIHLNNNPVRGVSYQLMPESRCSGLEVKNLKEIKAFEGVHNAHGQAFILEPGSEWYKRLDSASSPFLLPYISGSDISRSGLSEIRRYCVYTANLPLQDVKSECEVTGRFLENVVRPARSEANLESYAGLAERWWQFWNHRAEEFESLQADDHCLVFPKVSKYVQVMRAPSDWVYTNKVVLVRERRPDLLGITLSALFADWVRVRSGSLGRGVSISISEALRTFPLPREPVDKVEDLGGQWEDASEVLVSQEEIGLSGIMDAVHGVTEGVGDVDRLRSIRERLERELVRSYGWLDLDIEFDIRETRWGMRHSIAVLERTEIRDRLIELNRERE